MKKLFLIFILLISCGNGNNDNLRVVNGVLTWDPAYIQWDDGSISPPDSYMISCIDENGGEIRASTDITSLDLMIIIRADGVYECKEAPLSFDLGLGEWSNIVTVIREDGGFRTP